MYITVFTVVPHLYTPAMAQRKTDTKGNNINGYDQTWPFNQVPLAPNIPICSTAVNHFLARSLPVCRWLSY